MALTLPATIGSRKTNLVDMEIGDYIYCVLVANSTTATNTNSFNNFGNSETPYAADLLSGAATGMLPFFFVKVAKGLLVSDRAIQNTVTWDALNTGKFIQGSPWDAGNIIPTMTSNTAPSGVVSASNEATGYGAYLAFNKNYGSANQCWITDNTSTAWLQYQFATPTAISGYNLYPPYSLLNKAPKDWTFQAWDDTKQEWVDLDKQLGVTGWANNTKKTFSFPTSKPYTNYRLNILKNNGDPNIGLGELEMFETLGTIRSLTGGVAYADYPSLRDLVPKHTVDSTSIIGTGNKHYLFDDNTSTELVFPLNSPVGYDFGTPKLVTEVVFTTDNNQRAPKSWRVEGWNGSQWVIIHSITGDTSFASITAVTKKKFSFSNDVPYSKYQVVVTEALADTLIALKELEFLNPVPNETAISSTTDKGFGGWPTNNEWDKYIVNFPQDKIQAGKTLDDVFHYTNLSTWTQDTVAVGISANTGRITRGNSSGVKYMTYNTSSTSGTGVGFRPILEFKE